MPSPEIANTRVYQNHHLDSTRWDHVTLRSDDIVITTPYKCGTTWTQHITAGLLHAPGTAVSREMSPWVDARFWGDVGPIAAGLEAQTDRRFMKSHLALDGTRFDPNVQYVIVGRDLRDVFMSLLNHYGAYGEVAMSRLNDPDRPGAPIPRFDGDVDRWWSRWIGEGWFAWEADGWPFWSATHHWETWWTARHEPNVLFVHYADLKADPVTEIRRLAEFYGVSRDDHYVKAVAEASDFATMRERMLANEAAAGGHVGSLFEGGVGRFLYKGTNGRWRDVLGETELAEYEAKMVSLDPSLRAWLEGGRGDAV